MTFLRSRPGYIFLISVLVIGAVAATTAISLVLLGLASEQTGNTVVQSDQSFEYAQTCIERALRSLRDDLTYGGDETFTFARGSCTLLSIGGSGNRDRTLCAEGRSGQSVRRLEILVRTLYPTVTIATWREVSIFSLCS